MTTLPTQYVARKKRKANLLKIYLIETKTEFLKLLRNPMFVVPTLVFPLMFYAIFGLTFGNQVGAGGLRIPMYMLATYGAFGVIGCSLFSFGVGIATERGVGWLLVKKVSPMPPSAFLISKILMATLFNCIIVMLLFTLGMLVGKVQMDLQMWFSLAGVLILGALPFSAMGLALGFLSSPMASPAIANLIYIPMSFASGLWIPLSQLPEFFQKIAVFLPPYHFSQLALSQIGGAPGVNVLPHVLWLAGFAVLFSLIALYGYHKDEGKTSL